MQEIHDALRKLGGGGGGGSGGGAGTAGPTPAGAGAAGGVQFGKPAKARFLLGKDYFFVNHGAFGAASRSAFAAANCWREHAEVQPLKFIDRELLPLLVHTIREFAPFVNAMPEDLVFLPSATVGLNTVINAEARCAALRPWLCLWLRLGSRR